jgi:hypothetical protein
MNFWPANQISLGLYFGLHIAQLTSPPSLLVLVQCWLLSPALSTPIAHTPPYLPVVSF